MPVVYYSNYDHNGLSVSEAAAVEHELGRRLLLHGLCRLYGLQITKQDLPALIRTDSNGKPVIPEHPEIFFNITHCSGLAACAFHDQPIGTDAEFPGYFAEVLTERALSADEQARLLQAGTDPAKRQEIFWRFWTLKEAYVKRTGEGVDSDFAAVSFFLPSGSEITGSSVSCSDSFVSCSDPSVSCFQTKLPRGYILSLCTEAPMPDEPRICHIVF